MRAARGCWLRFDSRRGAAGAACGCCMGAVRACAVRCDAVSARVCFSNFSTREFERVRESRLRWAFDCILIAQRQTIGVHPEPQRICAQPLQSIRSRRNQQPPRQRHVCRLSPRHSSRGNHVRVILLLSLLDSSIVSRGCRHVFPRLPVAAATGSDVLPDRSRIRRSHRIRAEDQTHRREGRSDEQHTQRRTQETADEGRAEVEPAAAVTQPHRRSFVRVALAVSSAQASARSSRRLHGQHTRHRKMRCMRTIARC